MFHVRILFVFIIVCLEIWLYVEKNNDEKLVFDDFFDFLLSEYRFNITSTNTVNELVAHTYINIWITQWICDMLWEVNIN